MQEIGALGTGHKRTLTRSQDKLSKTDQSDKPRGDILVYQAEDGETKVEVNLRDETG